MSIRSIASQTLRLSFILLPLVLPAAARAAVSINEIMYNPAGTDTGREWVELYNNGSSDVTLVGGSGKGSWRIADSSNHTITDPQGGLGRGSLTIAANGYLILTSDPATFVGEYPGGAYSVAKASLSLNNTGTTISLIDGTGATISSIAYTASQGGNDDGTSLQMASSTWLQALPTPGAPNATESYAPPADTSDSSSGSADDTSSKSSSAPNPGYVAPPLPQMLADAGTDRTAIVGADTKFVATAYDRDRNVIYYGKFLWNFGDGSTAEGPWVLHHYAYPGRYAVELTITNTSLRTSSSLTITALPASVVLAALPQGGVSLQNKSGRDLDLSFWQVKDADHTFALPEYSKVLSGSSINISAATLGFAATDAKLYYPDGTEVPPSASAEPAAVPAVAAQDEIVEPNSAAQEPASRAPASARDTSTHAPEPVAIATTSAAQEQAVSELPASVAASKAILPLWTALAGLGGIMGLGVASVWAMRRRPVTEVGAEAFTIE